MADHAVLSASSSHRWLNCMPSARLELEFENNSSAAAEEGTAAHALCEYKLKKALHMRSKRPVSDYGSDEMEECTDAYAEFVMEQYEAAKQVCKDPLVLIEQRLDFSCYVPDGFGTGDCLIISDSRLHIIDFKYGMGVLVEAENNTQMKLYALGALEIYNSLYDFEEISMTIFQPRRENVSTWTIPVSALKDWAANELRPKAKKAYDGEGEYIPGEWCTFCRAAVKCRARAEEKLRLAQSEFKLPPLLTDSEIEEIMSILPGLTKWANEIMTYATEAAVSHGKEWNGFKVVEGRSGRKYRDEEQVAETAKQHGYIDIYRQSVIPMTEMQKLMGKTKFEEILGDLIHKPPGRPTLVPKSDKRPAMNVSNAKNDFYEIMEVN
ncbi:nuclease [Desulfosporosinus sp. Tol-M]|nr:nuclease [Desulfosporosinus sp. Tol-M]